MKRSILISALSLALLLAGCGESADDTTTTTQPAPATTTAAEPVTTTTATTAEPAVADHHPEDKGWELVWSDEFDGTQLDLSLIHI